MKAILAKENGTYFLKGKSIPNPAVLNLDNCDEIFGEINIEQLAEDDWDIYGEQFKKQLFEQIKNKKL